MTARKRKLAIPILIAIAICVIAFTLALNFLNQSKSPFSRNIKTQANFLIFYPSVKDTNYKVDPQTIKYDTANKTLSFVEKDGSAKLVFSEQATPAQFNEIPQYWDKLAEKLRVYSSFDSLYGKVALTHPIELQGGQSAMFNGKGTLIFINPSGSNLSDDKWKQLLNNFEIAK